MGAIVDHLSECNIQNFNSAGFITISRGGTEQDHQTCAARGKTRFSDDQTTFPQNEPKTKPLIP